MLTLAQVVTLALSGSPLLVVVLGLVQYAKKLGLVGIVLNIISMVLGLAFGATYMIASAKPTDFLGYFLCIVYGLLIGLVASGVYEVINPPQAKP